MAWTRVGATSGPVSFQNPWPAGGPPFVHRSGSEQEGDIMLLVLATDTVHTVDAVDDGSSGFAWTQVGTTQASNGNDGSVSVFRRVVAASEPTNYQVDWGASEKGVWALVSWRGQDPTTPLDVAVVQGNSGGSVAAGGTVTAGPITPTTDGCMIVALYGCDTDSTSQAGTPDSSPTATERADQVTSAAADGWAYVQDYEQATAAQVSLDVTIAQAESSGVGWFIVALRPEDTGGGAFELDAQPGSVAVTGQTASVPAARALNSAPGAYALTGSTSGALADRVASADPGAYALTGAEASALADRLVAALPGNYVLAGDDADLVVVVVFTLSADPGSYALAGSTAGALADRLLGVDPGAYALSGTASSFTNTRVAAGGLAFLWGDPPVVEFSLSAAPGSYAVAGAGAAAQAGRVLGASPGAYTLTGNLAGLLADRVLGALAGSYTLDGVTATLALSGIFELAADPGSYAVDGNAAGALSDRLLGASSGAYALTGSAAGLLADRLLGLDPGAYALSGAPSGVVAGRVMEAEPGSLAVAGSPAGVLTARLVVATPGGYVLTGTEAELAYSESGGKTRAFPGSGRTDFPATSPRTRASAGLGR